MPLAYSEQSGPGLLHRYPAGTLFLDGAFVPGAGRPLAVLGKQLNESLAEIGTADTAQLNAAVVVAARAWTSWRDTAPAERARLLSRMADLLAEDADAWIRLEATHAGKPLGDARIDILSSVATLRWHAGLAERLDGRVVASASSLHRYVRREPLGVVGLIVPWNFPLLLMLWKVAPALAAGNTVIVKPASLTPLTALLFAELAARAGLPAGVLNVLPGAGGAIGSGLARHPGVAKISFTGSTEVGRRVAAEASATVKRVTLELGGKSPTVILDDADLDKAIPASVAGCFGHAGQKCAARTRLIVTPRNADAVVERLLAGAEALRIGDVLDATTQLGPVIEESARKRILDTCARAATDGARLIRGGKAADHPGPYVEATIFDQVDPASDLAREEVFGPVLAVIRAENEEHALTLANDSRYGLAATLWTRDIGKAHRFAARLEAGSVSVNTPAVVGIETPFGGFKESGYGRELGQEGMDAYLQHKAVIMDIGA